MLGKMFGGLEEYAPLLVRLGLGTVFGFFGAQKLLGWFGGPGLEKTADAFAGLGFPIPAFMAALAAIGELGGGVLVALGLVTRYAAAILCIVMIVALFAAHGGRIFADGLPAFCCLILAISLLATGGGKVSCDRMFKIDERV